MGRGRFPRGGRGGGRDDREDSRREAPQLFNERLEKYYRLQQIVPEDELEQVFAAFRLPLPTTFRVTGSRANAEDVNEVIKRTHVPFLSNVVWNGKKQPAPKQISWYPGGLAWEFNVEKNVIRRSPEFKQFQTFLVHETDAGNLSRQEAVSMIPPLLLDIEPEHYVLDMCAAPGSKSAQLIEALHAKPDVEPTGFLMANDSDARRTHMLVHQTIGRIGSPNMLVTNLDASMMPNMHTNISGKTQTLRFDRVLADVPCTGDGTLRKNADIWRKWNPNEANSLHALQLRILLRGLALLKPGGRLVYSTCSLNPVENEAVISAALRESRGKVSLVDFSSRLPELKRRPGLTSWKVLDETISEVSAPAAGEKEKEHRSRTLAASLWPSGQEAELNLPYCVRIYPHLQDTGGFFIAVLEKAGTLRSNGSAPIKDESVTEEIIEPEEAVVESAMPTEVKAEPVSTVTLEAVDEASTAPAKVEPATDESERPAKRQKLEEVQAGGERHFKEDPYAYVPTTNTEMRDTLKYFGITRSFDPANLLVRNERGEPLRTVYHTATSVRAVVTQNDYKRIRLVSCGAKLLGRQETKSSETFGCRWRLMNDSVAFVRPHMTDDRIVQCRVETLRTLMDHYVPHDRFKESGFIERLKSMGNGSALLEVQPSQDAEGAVIRKTLLVPIWQAPVSLQLMLDKKEKSALSCRVFGKDITTSSPLKKSQLSKADVNDKMEEPEKMEDDAIEEANGTAD